MKDPRGKGFSYGFLSIVICRVIYGVERYLSPYPIVERARFTFAVV